MPNTGTISGYVYELDGSTPIRGATVACTGTLTCTQTTSDLTTGAYSLTGLSEGTHQITASITGYSAETHHGRPRTGWNPDRRLRTHPRPRDHHRARSTDSRPPASRSAVLR